MSTTIRPWYCGSRPARRLPPNCASARPSKPVAVGGFRRGDGHWAATRSGTGDDTGVTAVAASLGLVRGLGAGKGRAWAPVRPAATAPGSSRACSRAACSSSSRLLHRRPPNGSARRPGEAFRSRGQFGAQLPAQEPARTSPSGPAAVSLGPCHYGRRSGARGRQRLPRPRAHRPGAHLARIAKRTGRLIDARSRPPARRDLQEQHIAG